MVDSNARLTKRCDGTILLYNVKHLVGFHLFATIDTGVRVRCTKNCKLLRIFHKTVNKIFKASIITYVRLYFNSIWEITIYLNDWVF